MIRFPGVQRRRDIGGLTVADDGVGLEVATAAAGSAHAGSAS